VEAKAERWTIALAPKAHPIESCVLRGSDLKLWYASDPSQQFRSRRLRRAIRDDSQLLERKAEEVSKELVRGGYLHDEPAALVAEVLSDVEAGERRPQPQGPRPDAPDV
jgi:hypothetical protein